MNGYLKILTATTFAIAFFVLAPLLSVIGSVKAAEAKPAWQVELEKTLEEAKKEGRLNIYFWQGDKLNEETSCQALSCRSAFPVGPLETN